MNSLQVLEMFKPRLSEFGELCIAGGAVRDELMNKKPKDFDLFILMNKEIDFDEIKDKIKLNLRGIEEKEPIVEWHKSEPFLVSNLKVGDNEIQIMANPNRSVEDLVNTFDWNVCLFARSLERIYINCPLSNIGIGKELYLNKVTFPLSTLRRGFRFSERFKMKLKKEDILTLCNLIIEKHNAKNDKGPSGNEPDMVSLEKNILVN